MHPIFAREKINLQADKNLREVFLFNRLKHF